VTGTFLITLNKLDIIPRNEITEYLLPIGSVFECVLLSLALGERINQERRQKRTALLHAMSLDRQEAEAHAEAMQHAEVARKAQEITLRMRQDSNATLEKKVEERSRELADINQRLEELTRLDPLTGVRNRRFLHQRLRDEFQRAGRAGQSLAVLMVDVDHFKQVNDRYGHLVGDDALKAVANCLSCGVEGPGAIVTRFGGEEFCVLLPYANGVVAHRIAEQLRKAVQDHVIMTRGHVLRMTMSIGCFSGVPEMTQSPEEWLERADLALYDAKRQGRNRVCSESGTEAAS
jgi:diguanylate cyclase